MTDIRKIAYEIMGSALKAVDPYFLIKDQLRRDQNIISFSDHKSVDLSKYERIFICGAGKGTAPMTRAMEEILGDLLVGGDIIVKYEHVDILKKVKLHEAAHPVPDKNTLMASETLLHNMTGLTENDCVFVLLTGGGSALLEILPDNITLSDLQKLSSVLLECSATIHEINCIRKHISMIKGGQLARNIYPATCMTLVLSDVIGDDLSVIASGPTSPDPSTYHEALDILDKYSVRDKIPSSVLHHLEEGANGNIAETPDSNDKIFETVSNVIIGNNRLALNTAQKKAESFGYNTLPLTSMLEGEAKEIATVVSSIIREIQMTDIPLKKPACVLLGGEPTVKITGSGKGGRNQELALAIALRNIKDPFIFISVGTDGTDGPTDAAGAIVDNTTLQKAEKAGLNAREYLLNNDSYHFFAKLGDLIKTGPTGTNVMDVIFALIPE
jgi:glycerate-2-kinase